MLILAGMLTACQVPVVETQTEYITVPKSLYPSCPEMKFDGRTIGDLLEWNTSLYSTYKECKSDVNILIEYLESRGD